MTAMLPAARPKATRDEVLARIRAAHPDAAPAGAFIAFFRGYYAKGMGPTIGNDRGLYDDAAFIIGSAGGDGLRSFSAWNANADPGAFRLGQGTGAKKGMARLKPGVWRAWTFGHHKAGTPGGHRALVQRAAEVTVIRDGKPEYEHTGWFGINVHRGGVTRTNSEGCLTIPPDQWLGFLRAVEKAQQAEHGDRWEREPVCVVLVEGG
jgi:hypothetical protein